MGDPAFPESPIDTPACVNRDGSSLAESCNEAESIGFSTKPLRASFARLMQQKLPAIVHWEGKHYAIQENEISFYDVARKYIPEKELQRKGGYKGKVRRKDLKPEISAAVFAAKAPQLLKPIATSKKVDLILVEELVSSQLDEQLRVEILTEILLPAWLDERRKQIKIIRDF